MTTKHYYDWADIERACLNIALQMYNDNWKPDYIVGITRGGNVPATILSNMLGVRGEALKVSLRDANGEHCESNTWMSEDAFGYVPTEERETYKTRWDIDIIGCLKKRLYVRFVRDICLPAGDVAPLCRFPQNLKAPPRNCDRIAVLGKGPCNGAPYARPAACDQNLFHAWMASASRSASRQI